MRTLYCTSSVVDVHFVCALLPAISAESARLHRFVMATIASITTSVTVSPLLVRSRCLGKFCRKL